MFDGDMMAYSDLEVPYALTDLGQICIPDMAEKGSRYTCPECSQPLILKQGPIRRVHFAHARDTDSCPFYGESRQHILAKHLIVLAIQQWLDGKQGPPVVHIRCSAGEHDQAFPLQNCIVGVVAEKRIRVASEEKSYIPDVVLYNCDDKPVLCIEVFHKHAVNAEKEALINCATIEVQALQIINDPLNWHCWRGWRLPRKDCLVCKEEEAEKQRVQKWREDHTKPAVNIPTSATDHMLPDPGGTLKETARDLRIKELKTCGVWRKVNTKERGGKIIRTVFPCPLAAQEYNDRFYAYVDTDCESCNYLVEKDGPVSADILNGVSGALTRIKCAGNEHRDGDNELGLGPAERPHRISLAFPKK